MEQERCDRTQLSILPQNVQHLDQHFMKPGNPEMSVSRMLHFVQNAGLLNARKYGPHKKIKYGQSACVATVLTLLLFHSYSVLLYVHIQGTNITSLGKQSTFADIL
jgi:hypothetical protein